MAATAIAGAEGDIMESPKMQFLLTGFSQDMGFRVFAFERIAEDRTRTPFTVKTDLALTRRYGIRLQELPLLCRAVLERPHEDGEKRAFAYAEEDMRVYADCAAAREEAAKHRRPMRRPVTDHVGTAWRGPGGGGVAVTGGASKQDQFGKGTNT
jgi:hypothetical protein